MKGKYVTVLCYWGGSTYEGPSGLSYNGPPKTAIRLKVGSTYTNLVSAIYSAMKLDKTEFNVKMTCRYPTLVGNGNATYVPLQIVDDQLVECMLALVFHNTCIISVELYLEAERISTCDEVGQLGTPGNCVFTTMLTQDFVPVTQCTDLPSRGNSTPSGNNDITSCDSMRGSYEPDMRNIVSRGEINNDDQNGEALDNNNDDDDGDYENISEPEKTAEAAIRMDASDLPQSAPENKVNAKCLQWDPEMKELCKSLLFKDKKELQRAVKAYSIKNHQEYIVRETCKSKVSLICKLRETGCPWRLRACIRKGGKMWEITKYAGDHTCRVSTLDQEHSQLDAEFIAFHIQGLVKANPSIKVAVLVERIRNDFNYTVSYKKAWIAKKKAMSEIFGDKQ